MTVGLSYRKHVHKTIFIFVKKMDVFTFSELINNSPTLLNLTYSKNTWLYLYA